MKFPKSPPKDSQEAVQCAYESWHSYLYTAEWVSGKTVLDVGSGDGSGSYFLAQTAKEVTGIDFSHAAVDQAQRTFTRANLEFLTASADSFPFIGEKKFDVIVSFETIQYLEPEIHESFLSEVSIHLKDEGLLFISAPNKRHFLDVHGNDVDRKPLLKEFYEKEFFDFLLGYFPNVELLGMRVCSGSTLWSLKPEPFTGKFTRYDLDGFKLNTSSLDCFEGPVYFIAVCSKTKIGVIENSFLIDRELSIVSGKEAELEASESIFRRRLSGITSENSNLKEEIARRGRWGAELEKQLNTARERISALSYEVDQRSKTIDRLIAELRVARGEISKLNQEVGRRGEWGSNLDRELVDARSKISELTLEVARRGEWGTELNVELNALLVQTTELKTTITHQEQSAYNLETQLEIAKDDIKRVYEELAREAQCGVKLREQLKVETNKSIISDKEIVELRNLRQSLFADLAAEPVKISSLEEQIQVRERCILNLEEKLQVAQFSISQLASEYSTCKEHLAETVEQLNEAQQNSAELEQEVFRRGEWGLRLEAELKQATLKILEMDQEIVRRGEWGMALDADIKVARDQLARMSSTISWKITHPLRVCGRYLPRRRWKFKTSSHLKIQEAPSQLKVLNTHVSESSTLEYSKIKLPTSSTPAVSVIIPVYGQVDHTIKCLKSIEKNPTQTPFEVIIIDDFSPDDSVNRLSEIEGVRIIRNFENQGFIRSSNIGADAALGDKLYFLNNDTEVQPGWLDELVCTFDEFPGTGLVGSKLVYPDGRLQEAGCIIWQDGTAWNFGRGDNPELPIYNYAREVDYCSGASIMIASDLFRDIGGFDEYYLPAYCEDSDLALKVRELGYRVIYQPLSTICHFEGATSGKDIHTGTKSYQTGNLKKQFDRWHAKLRLHQPNGVDVDLAKDRCAKHRVLLVDKCTPTPDQDGGSIDIYNIALTFREMGFQVTFIPEDNFLYLPHYTKLLQRVGVEVVYAPFCTSVRAHLKEYGSRYNLVMLIRGEVVRKHLRTVRKFCPDAKVVFHTVDLHFLRMEREAQLFNDPVKKRAAEEMRKIELDAMNSVDATTVLSTAELDYLLPQLPNSNLHLLPFTRHSPGTSQQFNVRRHIAFVGGYSHPPNADAVKFFVHEVMPKLRSQLPGVKLYIIGSKVTDRVRNLAAADIIVVGYVEDLVPLLDSMRINIAPLRYGAGIKGKISFAMAMGLPTVATTLAAEGMRLTDGENILLADDADGLAEKIVELYTDETLWNKISSNSIKFSLQAWGPESGWKYLGILLSNLGFPSSKRNRPIPLYKKQSLPIRKAAG